MRDLTKLCITTGLIGLGTLVGSVGEGYNSRTMKYVGGGIILCGLGYMVLTPIESKNYPKEDYRNE